MVTKRDLAKNLIDACVSLGTSHLFGVPGGGSNLDVIGEAEAAGLRFVLTHTETAAAIMAGVAGELTGAPGLCVATRGPGAASALNGAAHADLDRQPLLLITDSVASAEADRISHQRIDQQRLFAPVTRASVVLTGTGDPNPIDFLGLGRGGQPGAVQVDLDPGAAHDRVGPILPEVVVSAAVSTDIANLLRHSTRPLLVVGVGAIKGGDASRSELRAALHRLAEQFQIPVLCTYDACGMMATSSPWYAGLFTGATIESVIMSQADLIVGIGLDPVEIIPSSWEYHAPVVLLGAWPITDSTYFGDQLLGEVCGDLRDLVRDAATHLYPSAWDGDGVTQLALQAQSEIRLASTGGGQGLDPASVVEIARQLAPANAIATVDAGAHMLPAMGLWGVEQPCHLLISSGLATMGFSLPAAISTGLHRPDQRVVCLTGDGGLSMVLGELETLARLDLNVTVIIFDDASLSLIAAKQLPEGHGGDNAVRYSDIDYVSVAAGLGLPASRCADETCYRTCLVRSFSTPGPHVLDVRVDPSAYPAIVAAIRAPRSEHNRLPITRIQ